MAEAKKGVDDNDDSPEASWCCVRSKQPRAANPASSCEAVVITKNRQHGGSMVERSSAM